MYNVHSLNRQQSPREEEQQRLLGQGTEWEEMADRGSPTDTKDPIIIEDTQTQDITASEQSSGLEASQDAARDSSDGGDEAQPPVVYRVYKRRWFGLLQLVLMNIIGSWGVSLTLSLPFVTSPRTTQLQILQRRHY